ncbi:MAG: hypothetical protein KBG28_20455 [Kofleriaceae bacterium]|jgi:hypothetical protein|nr:hypothetical protein [Kofleriaceae bacterium]MBP6836190.1 hypothetical protein [Kofleriaceae bacterium]MBP9206356.1 hypothetical protein [Kofleriaceae bacterium]
MKSPSPLARAPEAPEAAVDVTVPAEAMHLLAQAAAAFARLGVPHDVFMAAAGNASVDARPGMRELLADARLTQQLDGLRQRGLMPRA